MIGMGGWEIIKIHYSWIYAQGVDMGGSPKGGRHLHLIDTRDVVKIIWMGNATWLYVGKHFPTIIQRRPFLQNKKLNVME